ncbi:ATP-binding protein [Cupriavidus plantarum]|uniref:ATP-binding protein n=1 Tax=Cupriavidus plantarum TaxID=942865 RepID=UPI001B156F4F|nr:ATP-binding protein [Cupriavidus plantarum]CAG2128921.1 hypothetical protein LMG26296_01470 [Cupriavidus plantarum]SMR66396.1 AAA domain-containing protein, putative AbiEii toxin, Type IV TA system [Cupriavidus plantarum]
MLSVFFLGGKTLHATTPNVVEDANKYSVLVGKNGTGKSRLLKAIVETFVPPEARDERRNSDDLQISAPPPDFKLAYEYRPSSVIALSASPFDRFPLPAPSRPDFRMYLPGIDSASYEYLGIRGLSSRNLGISFMSRAITGLIDSMIENGQHAEQVCNVLNYLEYDGTIAARLQLPYSISKLKELLSTDAEEEDAIAHLHEYLQKRESGWRPNTRIWSANAKAIWHVLNRFLGALTRPRIDIVIDHTGVRSVNNPNLQIDGDFVFLLELGLLKLREVSLRKLNSHNRIHLNEASSGEQSVVLGFLGIAAHIQDGSLICIDEPEICLHPEWQERYIKLLISTFSRFKRCHFVIATHSPQIISRLEDENCFVLNIETGETVDASELIKRSSDFQLANTFGAPGYKNEYLSRELISLLTQFSKSGALSDEQVSFAHKLLKLKPVLDASDPVSKLMTMLEEVLMERLQ